MLMDKVKRSIRMSSIKPKKQKIFAAYIECIKKEQIAFAELVRRRKQLLEF